MQPFVRVLGSADWLPTQDNDGASYTLSDQILVDTGWNAVVNMINRGIDPLQMKTVVFTHLHPDHCLGLPQLMMYWRIHKSDLGELTIAGPKETVKDTVHRALNYVFGSAEEALKEVKRLPNIIELEEDDSFVAGDYRIHATASQHAVPGRCYRAEHIPGGKCVGFSGDTMYMEKFGQFFAGCEILLYECSLGAGPIEGALAEMNVGCKHSSAHEAVLAAQKACVKRLLLTHSQAKNRQNALETARKLLDIPADWAWPGQIFPF